MASKSKLNPRQPHHTEGNSMTSPTQTVVSKDKKPNPFIAEDLLKILSESIPPLLIKIQLIDSHPWNDDATKHRHVNTTPLTITSQNP